MDFVGRCLHIIFSWGCVPFPCGSAFSAPEFLFVTVLLLIILGWLSRYIMGFVLRKKTALQIILRTGVVVAGFFAVVWVAGFWVYIFSPPLPGAYGTLHMGYILYTLFFWFTAVVLLLTVFAPLLFVAAAKVILSIVELTVRRIAEYPKGPVIAASVVLAAVAAVIKLFT
jgi:hypothetical protein